VLICEWIGLIRGLHAVHLPHPPFHRFPAKASLSLLLSQDLLSPCAEAGAATASTCSPPFSFTLLVLLKPSFRQPLVQAVLRSGCPSFRLSFVQGRAVCSPGGLSLFSSGRCPGTLRNLMIGHGLQSRRFLTSVCNISTLSTHPLHHRSRRGLAFYWTRTVSPSRIAHMYTSQIISSTSFSLLSEVWIRVAVSDSQYDLLT